MPRRKYTDDDLTRMMHAWQEVIESALERANDDIVAAGKGWYFVAHAEAKLLARAFNVSTSRAAAVIAVLSPLTRWAQNLEDAWQAFEDGGRMRHALPANQAKAERLVGGEKISDVLGGEKVTSFWLNIADPEFTSATTNDSWVGEALGITESDLFGVKGVYTHVTTAFILAAAKFDLIPSQAQAIFWLQAKFEYGFTQTEREQYNLPDPY